MPAQAHGWPGEPPAPTNRSSPRPNKTSKKSYEASEAWKDAADKRLVEYASAVHTAVLHQIVSGAHPSRVSTSVHSLFSTCCKP